MAEVKARKHCPDFQNREKYVDTDFESDWEWSKDTTTITI
jgi:hypothetical protein